MCTSTTLRTSAMRVLPLHHYNIMIYYFTQRIILPGAAFIQQISLITNELNYPYIIFAIALSSGLGIKGGGGILPSDPGIKGAGGFLTFTLLKLSFSLELTEEHDVYLENEKYCIHIFSGMN